MVSFCFSMRQLGHTTMLLRKEQDFSISPILMRRSVRLFFSDLY